MKFKKLKSSKPHAHIEANNETPHNARGGKEETAKEAGLGNSLKEPNPNQRSD